MTRLSWNQCNIPGLRMYLCLVSHWQWTSWEGKLSSLLFFCHQRVASGVVYLSLFGTEITCLLISALVTHQRRMQHGFAVHTFLVHPVSGLPNDTQCSMDFLFIPDPCSGWASHQHRDSAWISCLLFLGTPVVVSPVSQGLSIDSMLTVSAPSVWPSRQLGT